MRCHEEDSRRMTFFLIPLFLLFFYSLSQLRIVNEENAQENYYSFGRHLAIIHEFVTILRVKPEEISLPTDIVLALSNLSFFLPTFFSTYLRDPSLESNPYFFVENQSFSLK